MASGAARASNGAAGRGVVASTAPAYTEDDVRSLNWREHIRMRPGMYVGKLGDGSEEDDGLYILLKEVVDNAVDEFAMGAGRRVEVEIAGREAAVRDYGRGVPLGKLLDCAAKINTGAKYDSEAFKRSVGLNGVGIKAVNALSSSFEIQSWREGSTRAIEFARGIVEADSGPRPRPAEGERNGTRVVFLPDERKFADDWRWRPEHIAEMLRIYAYLNPGLALVLNGETFRSERGLLDLMDARLEAAGAEPLHPPIHLRGEDVEAALVYTDEASGEELLSFVNGQNTTQGGSHLAAYREALLRGLREFTGKKWDPADIRGGLIAVIAVKVQEPVFESQTKTKLSSSHMEPKGRPLRTHIVNTLSAEIERALHSDKSAAGAIADKLARNQTERRDIRGVRAAARKAAKRARVHNKKLRDCRVHFHTKHRLRDASTLFITEGDSASGSITKARDPEIQAVFSLRGKPLNSYNLPPKIVYENEEFSLLAHALGLADPEPEGDPLAALRFARVVIATDADVDGMHIRLLLATFFLQFFPDLLRRGHLFILQTPLFRIRDKKTTRYCYDEPERRAALQELGKKAEITRFKGLGEINPSEFGAFIGPDIRLDPVRAPRNRSDGRDALAFFMGKNTPARQQHIIANLRMEAEPAPAD